VFWQQEHKACIRQAFSTDEALAQQLQLNRDCNMSRQTVANLAVHIDSKTWRRADDTATSVHTWTQEDSDVTLMFAYVRSSISALDMVLQHCSTCTAVVTV
jgi:hypothetical protein